MKNGAYKAELADSKTEKRHLEKSKHIRLMADVILYIRAKIYLDYSPEQIVGEAQKQHFNCVTVETIYDYLWKDEQKGGKLYIHLKTRESSKAKRGSIVNRIDIEHRPAIVEQKIRFNSFEMGLIVGSAHKGVLLTIKDRVTGILKMAKLDNKEASWVTKKAIELFADGKPFLNTITTDNEKTLITMKKL